ncbi:hypothetical protein G1E_00356 [Pseudomonas sp. TJI-51]|uniref:hypothetical protein n=1 Tax=Pseudomonas sp. (strain TJI-51) TaxID=985010 RepID=UPI0001FB94BE|nr:hypothetical protein [Pseudomonas sp. TJI-51]EGC00967.1 hypothetical protein G1E_00356 [Pseudomonas sp. TJI-51]EGD06471.1 hypothetical protein B1M_01242 [Burkholderia sp. TJI49]
MKLFKKVAVVTAAAGSAVAAQASFAAVDLTPVTGAFTAADVVTGVLAVAGTLAVIYVTIKAASTVLGMIRGR